MEIANQLLSCEAFTSLTLRVAASAILGIVNVINELGYSGPRCSCIDDITSIKQSVTFRITH